MTSIVWTLSITFTMKQLARVNDLLSSGSRGPIHKKIEYILS